MPYAVTIREGLEEKIRAGKISEVELVKALEQYVSEHPSLAGVIDPESADSGKRRTQEEWTKFFNEQGKAMISAPDIYMVAKIGSTQLIEDLRKDFYDGINNSHRTGLVTSTRTVYKNVSNPDRGFEEAKIVHNVGSTVVKPKEYDVVVPHFRSEWEILRTEEGLAYLRALFDTSDRPDIIEHTLIKLSGKSRESFVGGVVCDGCDFVVPYYKWKRDITKTATIFGYATWHHLGFGYYGDLQIKNHDSPDCSAGLSRGITYPRLEKAIDDCEQPSSFFGKVRALLTRATR